MGGVERGGAGYKKMLMKNHSEKEPCFGVDLCSGVRANDNLDATKLAALNLTTLT